MQISNPNAFILDKKMLLYGWHGEYKAYKVS